MIGIIVILIANKFIIDPYIIRAFTAGKKLNTNDTLRVLHFLNLPLVLISIGHICISSKPECQWCFVILTKLVRAPHCTLLYPTTIPFGVLGQFKAEIDVTVFEGHVEVSA